MKTILSLAVLIGGILGAPAALDSTPAARNVGNAEYPRITTDLRVGFRLKSPNAKQVQLWGGAGQVKEAIELVRGDEGVWTVTTPLTVPGFHHYWLVVDGLNLNDPASYTYFGWGRETSGIEVPGPDVDIAPWPPGAPGHGRTVDGQHADAPENAQTPGPVRLDWRDERSPAAGF